MWANKVFIWLILLGVNGEAAKGGLLVQLHAAEDTLEP